MNITVHKKTVPFRPWRPDDGRVFRKLFALDTETTTIDEQRHWITPALVLAAACDGRQGFFVQRQHVGEFFNAHDDVPLVFHNAPFDLAVIHQVIPQFDVYRWVDRHLAWDTQLMHRLYKLGSEGHTAGRKGEATLETCTAEYLGVEIPKDTRNSRGNLVRMSFGQFLNCPPQDIEPVYLEYLAKDALVTFELFRELQDRTKSLLESSAETWGYVSRRWSVDRVKQFGWQTHHIQLKAAIVLKEITANGLGVDLSRRDALLAQLDEVVEEHRAKLRKYGYVPGQKGSGKALQEILKRLDARHPDIIFSRTDKKSWYQSSEEALQQLVGIEPFINELLAYRSAEKLRSAFLDKMCRSRLHPSFNVLARSGRTSSFGELNAQNLPRDDRVRSCFVPSPKHVFIDADYSTVEMATLAQSALGQLGIRSRMAHHINRGRDLHRLVAARFFDKPESEVTKTERQKAKPINFGKPGGMGHATLQKYALVSYGVDLSDEEVESLSDSWFELFPEMEQFLDDNIDIPLQIAETLELSPLSYYEHTGSRKFLDHPDNDGREDTPNPILGAMLLKAVKAPEPQTEGGRFYSAEELDFFWSRLAERTDYLPNNLHPDVLNRRPSKSLQRTLMKEFGRGGVFTYSGRLRANATYAARHNTMFQGLAADGAKLALWLLWRAGYLIVNFIHDEVLVEIPENVNRGLHAQIIRRLMIEGMKQVVPDVRIDVEYATTNQWSKDARLVFDESGRLAVWTGTS